LPSLRSDDADISMKFVGTARPSFFSILFLVIAPSGIRWQQRSIRATG